MQDSKYSDEDYKQERAAAKTSVSSGAAKAGIVASGGIGAAFGSEAGHPSKEPLSRKQQADVNNSLLQNLVSAEKALLADVGTNSEALLSEEGKIDQWI